MAPPILVGLGANLESPRWGAPRETLAAALAALASEGVAILARSGWYRSAPVPLSDQPWFVNAAASVATRLAAPDLLALMQAVEHRFGRTRGERNAARVLDLDLLDYRGERFASPDLVLPHPRLHQRRFVLEPLAEIAPEWRHPTLGSTARQLIAALADAQPVERFAC
ncbi:MAG TPA: 2-amino-4-hydroxy-6-hydroxymethyldihydropteridine diphosphokinase [Stellaceae bacterium]|nr:2-amino-4-hydroxy-6-hydroxymethyldihydropteridine diphosphokinase [Stellaceae bacterium]